MGLISASVELTKKAAAEAVEKTAETAEHLTEFGKAGEALAAEQVEFGKITADECEKQGNFGISEDIFSSEDLSAEFGKYDEFVENCNKDNFTGEYDVLLEPQISFQGGLAACNARCLRSYCYPANLAKGISTKNPHAPNSKIGHT